MRLFALSCVLLASACLAQDALDGLHRVAVDDCGVEGRQPRRVSGQDWTYPADAVAVAKVPADSPLRSVSFGDSVVYRYQGLTAGATYRLRASFLSDSAERRLRVRLDGQTVIDNLALPDDEPLVRVVDIPAAAVARGSFELAIDKLAGPNAVVSLLELYSSSDAKLRYLTVTAHGDLAGSIWGHVADADQQPVDAAVTVTTPDGALKADNHTAGDGKFRAPLSSAWQTGADDLLTVTVTSGGLSASTTVPRCAIAPPRLTPLPSAPAPVMLDGTWQLKTAAGERPIEVPGEWTMQGAKVAPDETVTYERRLTVPADWSDRVILLRFDAVYSEARVLLDGQEVGGHLGGFTPFEIDITRVAKAGTEQALGVRVKNESVADRLASGSQYAAHPLGGITRSVRLVALPRAHVTRLHATTTLEANGRDATVHVAWAAVKEVPATNLTLSLAAPDGRVVATQRIALAALPGVTSRGGTAELRVANAQTWDPEHPRLYTLSAKLGDNPLVTRRIGLKQVVVRGNQVLCNGRPIKLHGVCRHEVHPRYGRALRDGLWRRDAELLKAANVNFVRTSHYPPAEAFLEACDEVGIFVEDEAPFCWAGNDRANLAVTVRQALEMVERDLSHACVLHWSVANESQWGANFDASAKAVQTLDPSRPRIFSYGDLDIASWHYPGPQGPARAAASAKPVLFDEYCHLNCYNRHELDADPGLRDEWGLALQRKYDAMWATQACLGGSIWAGIDDIFRLPDGSEVGYGSWGPLDGWRRAKPEYFHMRKAYSPVRVQATKLPARVAGRPLTLAVQNRFDFTDLADVRCTWRIGEQQGQGRMTGAPHAVGQLTLDLPAGFTQGRVELRFATANQPDVDSEIISVGDEPPAAPAASGAAPRLSESAERFELSDGRALWTVDRATGAMTASLGGKPVLLGGPTLMLLPLSAQQGGTTHSTRFEPYNPLCTAWKATRVEARTTDGGEEVTVTGSYAEADVVWTLRLSGGRAATLHYRATAKAAVNPRQIGPVFDIARNLDTLTWDRDGQWSSYPATHLGRLQGSARPEPPLGPRNPTAGPSWVWELDPTPMGCNDFRASRRGVKLASLTERGGLGWQVRPNGATVRAWVDGDRLRLLAATVDTGTSESFVASLFADRRRPLKAGDVVEGEIVCGLVE